MRRSVRCTVHGGVYGRRVVVPIGARTNVRDRLRCIIQDRSDDVCRTLLILRFLSGYCVRLYGAGEP